MQLVVEPDVEAAHQLLDGVADRLENPREILQILGDAIVEYEEDVFATRGHGAWAPLSPATIAEKGGNRILVDTGGLLDALTSTPAVQGESVGVSAPDYAGYLKGGARGMPRRDPAPEPDGAQAEDWAREVLGYLVHGRRL